MALIDILNGLPIAELLPDIVAKLELCNELVIEAAPGAGKTTAVPLVLLEAKWLKGRKILVLEPRRVAARAAAERMASLLGERVGQRVGYRIRLEKSVSAETQIEVITEGMLTRRLQEDPELAGVAALIFDEFHERSIHSDLGLALCLQGRELLRDASDPLKIIVMSATLDGEAVSELLDGAPVIRSEGRSFPVAVSYGSEFPWREVNNRGYLVRRVSSIIEEVYPQSEGDILVFLPGRGEIEHVLRQVQGLHFDKLKIYPLYGALPFKLQHEAIQPLAEELRNSGWRKLVLSTDLAETSLTIAGVTVVVDSGLAREPSFDVKTAMTRLDTVRISKASSVQRAGRAGRLQAGSCFRLWSESQQNQLIAHGAAEISHADLCPLLLQLLQWGVVDPQELRWLDLPPAPALAQAQKLLGALGALESGGGAVGGRGGGSVDRGVRLNDHGRRIAKMPLHPRLAHMLLCSIRHGLAPLAGNIAAVLSENSPSVGRSVDFLAKLQLLQSVDVTGSNRAWRDRCRRLSVQYSQMLRGYSSQLKITEPYVADSPKGGFAEALLLTLAYPDRLAVQRRSKQGVYLLSSGRSAKIIEYQNLSKSEWLLAVELGGRKGESEDIIYSAVEFDRALLSSYLQFMCKSQDRITWVDGRLRAEKVVSVGAIDLSVKVIEHISDEMVVPLILAEIRKRGLSILGSSKSLEQWRSRVSLLAKFDSRWPDVSEAHLLSTLDAWLSPYLVRVRSMAALKKIDLASILRAQLDWAQSQQLEELAPVRYRVPSGSLIEIDYSQCPPVLKVKLQEMFGLAETPSICRGKVVLLLHLLSPAKRPLQITQDLKGFWATSYHDVKKDMKGRYPKHPWPDEPWAAVPTQYTKHRRHAR
ncbi:MAG: ATP-dependent helicase HrpB [Flavobacteriales bacterium]